MSTENRSGDGWNGIDLLIQETGECPMVLKGGLRKHTAIVPPPDAASDHLVMALE